MRRVDDSLSGETHLFVVVRVNIHLVLLSLRSLDKLLEQGLDTSESAGRVGAVDVEEDISVDSVSTLVRRLQKLSAGQLRRLSQGLDTDRRLTAETSSQSFKNSAFFSSSSSTFANATLVSSSQMLEYRSFRTARTLSLASVALGLFWTASRRDRMRKGTMVAGGGAEWEVMKARRVVEVTFALRLEKKGKTC